MLWRRLFGGRTWLAFGGRCRHDALCFHYAQPVLPVRHVRLPLTDAMARPLGNRREAQTPGHSFRPKTTAWDLRWWILAAVVVGLGRPPAGKALLWA